AGSPAPVGSSPMDWWQIAGITYLIGLTYFLLKFLYELFSLLKLLYTHKSYRQGDLHLVHKAGNTQPFSFFKFIVIDPAQHSEVELDLILKHERA
ncbi:hypothetical protein HC175_23430, partial [Salinimicrobium sp. CDJ15-91]|nr:hypothetical protein [Salinimicrobium oceani]